MSKFMKSPWSWVPSLYFAEGLPYVIVMNVAVVVYKQYGMSPADITYYTSWLYLPWVIKPLWSPFVDVMRSKRWWIVVMQLLIGAALGGIAFSLPTPFWLQGSLFFFWLLAFSSATHDIAADGFYMLGLNEHSQSKFVGVRSTVYRVAMLVGQSILVALAGNIQVIYRNNISLSWSLTFYATAALFVLLLLWHQVALPHPIEDKSCKGDLKTVAINLWDTIKSFVTKYPVREVSIGLLFMLLYRMPEGLLSKIVPLFLLDKVEAGGMGLSPQDYAFAQGAVGTIGLIFGGIIGGILISRDGLKKWLWPMVFAITLPDLVYVYMSFNLTMELIPISLCLFVEQFGYGFGFTAYMLYLIYYSRGKYKTSHYALCTAFMSLSMMLPGLISGALQTFLGYQFFFIFVMITCVVTFVMSALVKLDPDFGKRQNSEEYL